MTAWPTLPLDDAGYASADDLVDLLAEAIRFPVRRSVSAWAADRRILTNAGGGYSGPWSNAISPFLVEIMDALGSGRYRRVVVQGPAQCGKTEIGLNWLGATIEDAPANLLVIQPDKMLARTFSVTRVAPMIEAVAQLRDKMRAGSSDDTVHEKTFRAMTVSIVWPVASQLRQRPAARYWADDFDALPDDIEGEGDVVVLLEGRATTYEGREIGLVTSSPAKGSRAGVEALRKAGTDKRWHWRCPHCEEPFEASSQHLVFDRTGSPDDAEASVAMACPNNGCVIEPRDKRAMMATGAWLGAGQTLDPDGQVLGEEPAGTVASYLLDGVVGFASWGALARDWRAAEIRFADLADEQPLRAFHNARLGLNYTSRIVGRKPLTLDTLGEAPRGGFVLRRPPAEVAVLIASIDVQGDRFEVQVTGFGEGLQSWIVDRFPIRQLGDGRTNIDPAGRPEHWHELLGRVIWQTYEREDGATLEILNTAIDTGGLDGATANAYAFWHAAMASGVHRSRLTLVKGSSRHDGPIVSRPSWVESPAGAAGRHGAADRRVPLYLLNVNRLKSVLDARLRREEPGPGFVHLPDDMSADHLAELLGEERDDRGQWKRVGPNETLDLTVYAIAGLTRHAGTRTNMAWLPARYRAKPRTGTPARRPDPAPTHTKADDAGQAAATAAVQPASPPPVAARRRRRLRGRAEG